MSFTARVAVVGGGIAGLTVAYRLHQQGVGFRLIESEPVLGGKIRTETVDGFVIEGGPDSFLSEKPWARELCEELGLADQMMGTNDAARQTYLVSRGRLRPIPDGLVMLVPVRPMPLLRSKLISPSGVARMAIEPLIPRRRSQEDESLGAFVRRRFGDQVHERIVDPLMSGIYAGDSDQLSLQSTFPRLRELEQKHGSIIRGLLATRSGPHSSRSMFLSLRGGLQQLVDALVARFDRASLLTGVRVLRLDKTSSYQLILSDGRALSAAAVVLATPAFTSAELIEGIDPELATLLGQIPYVSTATISLAYRSIDVAHPMNGFGFVVPRVERRRITACTWVSTKLQNRAPEDAVLLRCFVGRTGEESWLGLSDTELVELARDELRELMGIEATPLFSRVYRWPRSMPQYLVGHQKRLEKIRSCLARHQGLFLTGSAYRGVGLPDCIRDATETARSVTS